MNTLPITERERERIQSETQSICYNDRILIKYYIDIIAFTTNFLQTNMTIHVALIVYSC